jgi:hypothetical protein
LIDGAPGRVAAQTQQAQNGISRHVQAAPPDGDESGTAKFPTIFEEEVSREGIEPFHTKANRQYQERADEEMPLLRGGDSGRRGGLQALWTRPQTGDASTRCGGPVTEEEDESSCVGMPDGPSPARCHGVNRGAQRTHADKDGNDTL